MTGSSSSSTHESGAPTGASVALIFGAAGWGVLSAASLVIGAVIGVVRSPPKTVSAVLMSYGSGALIEALSIELFAHIIHMSQGEKDASGEYPQQQKVFVYLAIGMAVFGGMTFAGMNKFLNDAGGWARKMSTLKSQVLKRRLLFDRMLANKLKAVPMFEECLSQDELQLLASKMFTDVFQHGGVIFHDSHVHSPIYFLLYGTVRVDVFREDEPDLFEHLNLGPKLAATAKAHGDKPAPPLINQIDMNCPPIISDLEMDTKMDCPSSPVISSPQHQNREVVHSYLVRKNQLFGEMTLFMGDSAPTQAVAVTDCKVLKLHFHEILDLVEKNPQVLQYLTREAARGIGRTPLFEGCRETTLDSVVACMARDTFESQEVIFDQVDSECPIYYLVFGKVELLYPADHGGEEQRRVVRPTSLFGTDHFISGSVTRVQATALDRSLVLCVERADLQRIVDANDEFRESLTKVRLRAQSQTMAGGDCATSSPKGFARDAVRRASKGTCSTICTQVAAADLGWLEDSTVLLRQGSEDSIGQSGSEGGLRGRRCTKAAGPVPEVIDLTGEVEVLERTTSKLVSLSFTESIHPPRSSLLSVEALKDLSTIHQTELMACTEVVMDFNPDEPSVAKALRRRPSLVVIPDPAEGATHSSGHPSSSQRATMIWLGILIDAVPESVVLGIMASTASTGRLLTFVIGVFLSNLPEAMSSSGTMARCGIPARRIVLMWSSIVGLTGVGAALGAAIFPPGSETNFSTQLAIAAIDGMCGGAMLTMIANTALPEAFEQGGDVVGLSCLAGFLSALFVSVAAS